jgi:hypothetical protein
MERERGCDAEKEKVIWDTIMVSIGIKQKTRDKTHS